MNKAEAFYTVKDGNSVFEEIVNEWQAKVYNTALGIAQHEQDAEDITQEVFISLYQHLDNFRETSGLSTWIYKITVNKAIDHEKKQRRSKRGGFLRKVFSLGTEEEPVNFTHPGVMLDNKERATVLFAAIKQLPDKQRIAFTLQKMEGLSNKEIAGIMDTSLLAVESLQLRARTKLRKILAAWYYKNELQ